MRICIKRFKIKLNKISLHGFSLRKCGRNRQKLFYNKPRLVLGTSWQTKTVKDTIKPVLQKDFWDVYSPPIKKLVAIKETAEWFANFHCSLKLVALKPRLINIAVIKNQGVVVALCSYKRLKNNEMLDCWDIINWCVVFYICEKLGRVN